MSLRLYALWLHLRAWVCRNPWQTYNLAFALCVVGYVALLVIGAAR
jgi:hypothetical protein